MLHLACNNPRGGVCSAGVTPSTLLPILNANSMLKANFADYVSC